MANGYDRDDRWNRGNSQRGSWQHTDQQRSNQQRADWQHGNQQHADWQHGNQQRADWQHGDRPRWDRPGEQWQRGRSQAAAWSRDDDHRRGEDLHGGGYDSEMYGRGESSYGESYGDARRSYRHGTGQGYGGEHHFNPGYGGQGAYGAPGSSTYGSGYGSSSYGSNYGPENYAYGSERERSRGFGMSDYRSNWGRGTGSSSYDSDADEWQRQASSSNRSGYGSGYGYAGRGPKGYKRSDERIKEDVCDRLSLDDDVDASDITVSVRDGEVTLDGSVETRRMKHRAEDIAEAVQGVSDVHNNVRVVKGFLNEMVDRVTGNEREQHYANSGTRNTASTATTTGHGPSPLAR